MSSKYLIIALVFSAVMASYVSVAQAAAGWRNASYWVNSTKTPEYPCTDCGSEWTHRLYWSSSYSCSGAVKKWQLLNLGGNWWGGYGYVYQATKSSMVVLGCLDINTCTACTQVNPYCSAYDFWAYCNF